LGNEKPEFLARVEKALWTTLLRIASGSGIATELPAFMQVYSSMSELYAGSRRQSDWFAGSESVFVAVLKQRIDTFLVPPQVSGHSQSQITSVVGPVSQQGQMMLEQGHPAEIITPESVISESPILQERLRKSRSNEAMLAAVRAAVAQTKAAEKSGQEKPQSVDPPTAGGEMIVDHENAGGTTQSDEDGREKSMDVDKEGEKDNEGEGGGREGGEYNGEGQRAREGQ
jgi:hypothetical protein